ncbi:Dyp-type peroxidase [Modestobacter marinus]|uniref:Dyp-type peroxidase n=1 Tax=Modestobacter marinus TaxID=477641 RepID=UPI001C9523C5|nr:Dyp-type peroxidase [Modestobacter marinus]
MTITAPTGASLNVTALELDDIQAGTLRPRPDPYAGAYLALRIDDRRDGQELVRRLAAVVSPAAEVLDPLAQASLSVGFSFAGLQALGVPQDSLDTFAPEFRQGMAARAEELGDVGPSAPAQWERPLGSSDVHVVLVMLAPDVARFEATLATARAALDRLPGIGRVWRQDVYSPHDGRNVLGFHDGISQPGVESSGVPGSNPHEALLKPGEFVLGYLNETGDVSPAPQPEVLGRNGSYLVFRKLYTDVAAFRRYFREQATSPAEEQALAAKLIGRWPSGAPLALAPDHDEPELGADPDRNNAFLYGADDPQGLACPVGSHARRMNPRDAAVTGEVRLHRLIRRGASYGPQLPEGILDDDGGDRGLLFAAVNANLARQFEFVQAQWGNDGKFIGAPDEHDPLIAAHDEHDQLTVPHKPIRRRLKGLPTFVVNRGGEYCFQPGIRALRWLGDRNT